MGNIFAGVSQAKTSERGAFCNPGLYKVKIKRVLLKHTRKNYDAFIVEFEILESNYTTAKADAVRSLGDRPFDAAGLEKTLPNKVGSTASWFQSLQDKDIGFGSIKGFAARVTGQQPESPEFCAEVEGLLEAACDPTDQAFAGWICPLEVIQIQTKKNTAFSLYQWGRTENGLGEEATVTS